MLQLSVLQEELRTLRGRLSEANLDEGKRDYLQRASDWPPAAIADAKKHLALLTVDTLSEHLEKLVALIDDTIDRGPVRITTASCSPTSRQPDA
jgi:hypothetical protein